MVFLMILFQLEFGTYQESLRISLKSLILWQASEEVFAVQYFSNWILFVSTFSHISFTVISRVLGF